MPSDQLARVCAWCWRSLGAGDAAVGPVLPEGSGDTHGICRECRTDYLRHAEALGEGMRAVATWHSLIGKGWW